MSSRLLILVCLLLATLGQFVLLVDLAGNRLWVESNTQWLLMQVILSVVTTVCSATLLGVHPRAPAFHALLFGFSALLPGVGALGSVTALYLGSRESRLRQRAPDYWTITRRTELPFTTPSGRQATTIDSRGFTEHLLYSQDDNDLYRKVLSAGNIQSSLSVSALQEAMRHSDERIRLTAFKTLDRKVTELNRQIQQLESHVLQSGTQESSNSWLQIASNYWELLTLEQGEPVARQHLLDKAAKASIQAVAVLPVNRNAHFILGQVSLLQGDTRRARVALERARALGMPAAKVLPYLAEAAFMRHDFTQVRDLLRQLDPAIRAYPPLSHVAEYWN
ncbi:MAG: hypothetical protein HKN42_02425 [Granulosicoccus sp.]|nr:hypothetical protein [Granulosicoccus sp.]